MPGTIPAARQHLIDAIAKKARGAMLRFVVLEGIGRPVNWNGPEPALLEAAYARISSA